MPIARRLLLACLLLAAGLTHAQERFSPFVPSDQENVERMLKLAQLRDDDVVVDLGSGDGRIVLTAAPGAHTVWYSPGTKNSTNTRFSSPSLRR